MELKRITAPAVLPITEDDINYHLRLDGTDHTFYIEGFIQAATDRTEAYLGRRLITQTWDMICRSWEDFRRYDNGAARTIPYGMTQSITHIKYVDIYGVEQTIYGDDYAVLFTGTDGAQVAFLAGYDFPDLHEDIGTVTARFVCGYGLAADVPEAIKAAIRLICGDLFDGKDNSRAVESLLAPYRLFKI